MRAFIFEELMWRLVLSAILACAAWCAYAADTIDKGAEDLLKNSTLSQPFTVLDQLLLSLDRKATEVAKSLRPEKNDFRPSHTVSGEAHSRVSYERSTARTVIQFRLTVSGIDDPWRDVCAKRVKNIVTFGLELPYHKEWEQEFRPSALGFFADFLGPRLTSDPAQLANYKGFSDSIVVVLNFLWKAATKRRR